MHEKNLPDGSLPEIVPGAELLSTPNYRVVTDFKPGSEGHVVQIGKVPSEL